MAERLPDSARLGAVLGRPRSVRRLYSSPRSRVWLADLGDRSVVVKQVAGGTDADARYRRELAALRLAGPLLGPELLAEDPAVRVLVLEYLDAAPGLPDWVAYATGLARLHAAGGGDGLPAADRTTRADVAAFLRLCSALGVEPSADVPGELDRLVDRLAEQAGAGALLHGDPCFGNVLAVAGQARFIDFEQAAAGNGLTELAYLRIGFPTCGLVEALAEGPLAAAEAAYYDTWRAATGGEPTGSVADQCVGWLLRGDALVARAYRGQRDQFARLLTEDWRWGPASARQRLAHRLGVVGGLTADDLAATTALAGALRTEVLARWSAAAELPVLPV